MFFFSIKLKVQYNDAIDIQLQVTYRMYAAEGRIRREYELFGAKYQFDDTRRRGSHDEQTPTGGAVHGPGRW